MPASPPVANTPIHAPHVTSDLLFLSVSSQDAPQPQFGRIHRLRWRSMKTLKSTGTPPQYPTARPTPITSLRKCISQYTPKPGHVNLFSRNCCLYNLLGYPVCGADGRLGSGGVSVGRQSYAGRPGRVDQELIPCGDSLGVLPISGESSPANQGGGNAYSCSRESPSAFRWSGASNAKRHSKKVNNSFLTAAAPRRAQERGGEV